MDVIIVRCTPDQALGSPINTFHRPHTPTIIPTPLHLKKKNPIMYFYLFIFEIEKFSYTNIPQNVT